MIGESKVITKIILSRGQDEKLAARARKVSKKHGGPLSRSELARRIFDAALRDRAWMRDAVTEAGK